MLHSTSADCVNERVAEAELHHPRAEALDHHIGALHQAQERLASASCLRSRPQAAFVAVTPAGENQLCLPIAPIVRA